jgi:DNA primase
MENMGSRQDISSAVKEQTDIVKIIGENIDLKKSGVRYLGLCPFHGEKTPSFSVNGAQQFFYCFGCGESGDVFSFVMKYHNMDFPAALKMLASRLNIEVPEKSFSSADRKKDEERQRMFTLVKKTAEIYHRYLLEEKGGEAGRNYLYSRGIPVEIWRRFLIGYAPSKDLAGWDFLSSHLSVEEKTTAEKTGLLVQNERGSTYDRFRDRVLFPIYDLRGRACGFGGRIVGEGQPKYMNSPESVIFNKSKLLLGLYQQNEAIRKKRQVLVVEGNFDMISLVVHDCNNVVAPLGTALTASQVRLLKRFSEETILLFDGDKAGRKAVVRAAPYFFAEKVNARVALLPEGHDPDTYVVEHGKTGVAKLVEQSIELSEFILQGVNW